MSIYNFALAVLVVAIIVVFSPDFKKVFKKIFAYKSVQLLLPLFAASILFFSFYDWMLWGVYYYLKILNACIGFFSPLLSFTQLAQMISQTVVLTLISVLPVFAITYAVSKKSYVPFQYPYFTSTIIWIVSAMLLVVS